MFEDLNKKNTFVESLEALLYLLKINAVRSFFYFGALPFAVLWVLRNSLSTAFALQAYLLTAGVFAVDPFESGKQKVKKWWFWKTMLLGGVPIHTLFLVGIWRLDVANSSFVSSGATLFLLVFVSAVLESILLSRIVTRFRPRGSPDL